MDMKEAVGIPKVFRNLRGATREKLMREGRLRKVEVGEHLFYDREIVSTIYITLTATAALYKMNSLAERKVIFVYKDGEMLNEVILQEVSASVNCEILEGGQVYCIGKDRLLSIMEGDFELARAVLDSSSMKIRRLYRQLKNTTNSIRGDKRIAAKLWKLSGDYGVPCREGVGIDMKLSITYLADFLGFRRETVSRQLKILTDQGLVVVRKSKFIIPDRKKLQEYFKAL